MRVKDKKWIRFRIYLVAIFFVGGLGIILARAYQLQVLEKDKLASIARAGYRDIIKLPPKRGTIYDREGHELAVSVEVESIYAHPNRVEKKPYASKQLSKILDLEQRKILKLLNGKDAFVWLRRKISPDRAREVEALRLEGIGSVRETRRFYTGREIAAHLIGFTGDDNIGLEGLEKKYDRILKGPRNTIIQMRDALGKPFFVSGPASEGEGMHDLVLTIDKDIQYKAQQSLYSAVKKAKAKSGHCIIVEPETGEVLAMAVVPLFNPNVFRRHEPYQWRNRTVTDCYEPGSTIKAFLLAAALERSIISPQTRFFCEKGEFQLGRNSIHDTHGYGYLSASEIVTLSSNIGAVKIGQMVGYERFYEYLEKFGFGSQTGIDLIGERKGFIRDPGNAKPIDRATVYFGQGLSVSSIQLTMAMAAIANGGKLMRPFVVKRIKDQQGRVLRENRPQMVRRVLSPKTARKVARILEGVVGEKGTAPLAAIKGYRVGGKTGTSQKVDPGTKRYSASNYTAVFVGFAPVDNPKLAILVTIDEPRGQVYGGLVAGPVFGEVGGWTLNHLRINPQLRLVNGDEGGEKREEPDLESEPLAVESAAGDGLLPDFKGKGMREALKMGRSLGLTVVLEGTGLAFNQVPGPGASLEDIGTVKIRFRPPA
jgi:cell division protein FtsI (penicillin-binding protein 3)